jgi:hypothetical protein
MTQQRPREIRATVTDLPDRGKKPRSSFAGLTPLQKVLTVFGLLVLAAAAVALLVGLGLLAVAAIRGLWWLAFGHPW